MGCMVLFIHLLSPINLLSPIVTSLIKAILLYLLQFLTALKECTVIFVYISFRFKVIALYYKLLKARQFDMLNSLVGGS